MNWLVMRTWQAGRDSLVDIQTKWSVNDLVAVRAFLELEGAEMEYQQDQAKAEAEAKAGRP